MWIEAESPNGKLVDAAKLDTIYVVYKGQSHYAVVGSIGDRDITLKILATGKEAAEWLLAMKAKLEID